MGPDETSPTRRRHLTLHAYQHLTDDQHATRPEMGYAAHASTDPPARQFPADLELDKKGLARSSRISSIFHYDLILAEVVFMPNFRPKPDKRVRLGLSSAVRILGFSVLMVGLAVGLQASAAAAAGPQVKICSTCNGGSTYAYNEDLAPGSYQLSDSFSNNLAAGEYSFEWLQSVTVTTSPAVEFFSGSLQYGNWQGSGSATWGTMWVYNQNDSQVNMSYLWNCHLISSSPSYTWSGFTISTDLNASTLPAGVKQVVHGGACNTSAVGNYYFIYPQP